MSRTNLDFSNSFSNNQNLNQNFGGFSDVWQTIDDISSLSFELLLPSENLLGNKELSKDEKQASADNIFAIEELLMRQNLVDLAIREDATVRENKNKSYVNLLVRCDDNLYTKEFKENIADMTADDIKFFELVASKQNIYVNSSNPLVLQDSSGKTVMNELKFSKNFMEMIEYAYTGNRPIRIDFAKDSALILRIDSQGKVSAEFISSDKAMEFLLKTNIPNLKQKLDNSGIKYKKIYYKDNEENE